MKFRLYARSALALSASLAASSAHAQSRATAIQTLDLSAFGGVTYTDARLADGKNIGVTGGGDLGIRSFHWFKPSIELRATYPFYKGDTASMKNILGGVKAEKSYYGKLHPYVDGLFGRAEINYQDGGYPNPQMTFRYLKSPSNVLSIGGGADYDLTYHFSFKADVQWQHYATPVTTSGHFFAYPITLGVVYRFNFNHVYVPPTYR